MFSEDGSEYKAWEKATKALAAILIVGLAVRLILALTTYSAYDSISWIAIMDGAYRGDTIYEAGQLYYTPVWGYFLYFTSAFADIIGMGSFGEVFPNILEDRISILRHGHGFVMTPQINLLLKFPVILIDILGAFLAYKLVGRLTGDQKKAIIGCALWFLCPLTILSSSALSMFDGIMVVLMMFSLLSFMDRRYFLAGLMLSAAVLTKMFAIILIPVMVAYILSDRDLLPKERIRNLLYAILGVVLMFLVIYLPVLMTGEFSDSISFLTLRSESLLSGTGTGSFGRIILFAPVLVIGFVILMYLMARAKENRDRTFMWLALVSMAIMFSIPTVTMTAQFGLMLLPPILILYSLRGNISIIPWILLLIFAMHGITHYWGTLFYPLVYFGVDISGFTTSFPSDTWYHFFYGQQFLPGLSILVIMLCLFLKDRIFPKGAIA